MDEEIPFEIPEGWEWCRLSHIGITETGTTPSKTHPEYFGNYMPFIGPANILEDKIISETQGLSEEGIKYSRVIPANSILQVCIGGSIGKCAIVRKEVTFNQQINSITPIKCCLEYVHYVLQSETFRLSIMTKATGTATPIINRGNWEMLLFPLPPYNEQNRIVEKLDSLKIKLQHYTNTQINLQELNNNLHLKLKKSILQEAIQGKLVPQIAKEGTAQELLEQIKAEKQKLVKEGKLKKSALTDSVIFKGDDNKYYEQIGKQCKDITVEIPFEIPATWDWCRINTIAISQLGKTLDRGKDIGKEYPYVCSINVYWEGIELSKVKTFKLRDDELCRYRLLKGDLLVCEGGDYGRCCVWDRDEEMYYQNALHRIRFFCGLIPMYYKYVFELYRNIGYIVGQGQTIKHFTYESMKSIVFPVPPIAEQQRIVAQIERLFEQLK